MMRSKDNIDLPMDILVNILSRLRAKNLVRLAMACRLWFCLIYHPYFIEGHLKLEMKRPSGFLVKDNNNRVSPTLFFKSQVFPLCYHGENESPSEVFQPIEMGAGTLSIADSCNGLVCFTDFTQNDLISICNPATREHVRLPPPEPFPVKVHDIGFAYDRESKNYKVFRIFPSSVWNPFQSSYEVFTLGSKEWRPKGRIPYYYNVCKHIQADGSLYWISGMHKRGATLVSINVSTEQYRVIRLPEAARQKFDFPCLIELNGNVSLCTTYLPDMELWVLTDKENSTWTRKYQVYTPAWIRRGIFTPYPCSLPMKNNEILIHRGGYQLVFYNIETEAKRIVDTSLLGPNLWSDLHVVEHIETLVPCKFRWAAVQWPEIMETLDTIFPNDRQEEFRLDLELRL